MTLTLRFPRVSMSSAPDSTMNYLNVTNLLSRTKVLAFTPSDYMTADLVLAGKTLPSFASNEVSHQILCTEPYTRSCALNHKPDNLNLKPRV